MPGEGDRPQDVGRRHRATIGAPTPETAAILERYRAAMRAELGDVLEELRPPAAQLDLTGGETRLRPPLADRVKLWDLAIKIGRELAAPGAGGDPDPAGPPDPVRSASRPRQAPRLSARERKALGG